MSRCWRCRSSRARSRRARTSGRCCRICANPARSSRTPTSSCSSIREEYYLARGEPMRRPDESDEKFNDRYDRWQERLEASPRHRRGHRRQAAPRPDRQGDAALRRRDDEVRQFRPQRPPAGCPALSAPRAEKPAPARCSRSISMHRRELETPCRAAQSGRWHRRRRKGRRLWPRRGAGGADAGGLGLRALLRRDARRRRGAPQAAAFDADRRLQRRLHGDRQRHAARAPHSRAE